MRLRRAAGRTSRRSSTSSIASSAASPELNLIRSQQAANVQRSIHLQAVALWLLGGLLGLVTLGVLGQLLARQAFVEAAEHSTLRALGMTRGQLWASGMVRASTIGMVAAGAGVGLAVVASPLTPIGTARVAELHPGVTVDPWVLILGAAATLALVVAVSAWPVWRATAVDHRATGFARSGRPSVLDRASAAAALPPTLNAGVRMALEPGSGRTAVPVRSSLLAVIVAVAALGRDDELRGQPRPSPRDTAPLRVELGRARHHQCGPGTPTRSSGPSLLTPASKPWRRRTRRPWPSGTPSSTVCSCARPRAPSSRSSSRAAPPGARRGRPRHRDPPTGPCPRGLDGDDPDHRHRPQPSGVPRRGSGRDPTPVRHGPSGQRGDARLRGRRRLVPPDFDPPPISDVELRLAPGVDRPGRWPISPSGWGASTRSPRPSARPTSSTSGGSRTCR